MVNILVCGEMDKDCLNKLMGYGYIVESACYEYDELRNKIKHFDVIVANEDTKLDKALINEGSKGNLKLILINGVKSNNIDVKYASQKGICVRNTSNSISVSIAELTIAHMFALTRYIHNSNLTMREGKWEKKNYNGVELFGKTLGLIGFGTIAKEVAIRAEAIGMKVIYNDKLGKARGFERFEFCDKEDLIRKSDFISLHIHSSNKTKYIIGKEEIAIMKNGVYIINCALSGLIDECELVKALNIGKVAGVGLDVFDNEPKPNLDLINNCRVCATPHIGAITNESKIRSGLEIVDIIYDYFNGKCVVNM